MKNLESSEKESSIRTGVISLFIIFIILTVGIAGSILFMNWNISMEEIYSNSAIIKNMKLALVAAVLALLLSLIVFIEFIRNHLRPMNSLLFFLDKPSKDKPAQKVKDSEKDGVEKITEAFNLRLILDSTAGGSLA